MSSACIASLESADESAPMCQTDNDCNVPSGQICDIGVCWGGASDIGQKFGAQLIPPPDRDDLVVTELSFLEISDDGVISDLAFMDTVAINAQLIRACTDDVVDNCGMNTPVQARVVITRPSTIRGGPGYQKTLMSTNEEGPTFFQFRLPRDGQDYRVTVIPESPNQDGSTNILSAPPMSAEIKADSDQAPLWELGKEGTLKTVRGCVINSSGSGSSYSGIQVSAQGRWQQLSDLERASATVTTNAFGCYEFSVPINMLDEFDVIVVPPKDKNLPTLRLANEFILDPQNGGQSPYTIAPLVMPNTGPLRRFQIPVMGDNNSTDPILGSSIELTTYFSLPENETRNIAMTHTVQATLTAESDGQQGTFSVDLFSGTSASPQVYQVDIQTPPESVHASRYRTSISLEQNTQLDPIVLEGRGILSGNVLRFDGVPLANASLSVRLADDFREELVASNNISSIERLIFPTKTTDSNGFFSMRLDQNISSIPSEYSIDIAPSDQSSSPSWTIENVRVSDRQIKESIFVLPSAVNARGVINDAAGTPVPGAEIRIYQLVNESDCPSHLDACSKDAPRRASANSRSDGSIELIFPDF